MNSEAFDAVKQYINETNMGSGIIIADNNNNSVVFAIHHNDQSEMKTNSDESQKEHFAWYQKESNEIDSEREKLNKSQEELSQEFKKWKSQYELEQNFSALQGIISCAQKEKELNTKMHALNDRINLFNQKMKEIKAKSVN